MIIILYLDEWSVERKTGSGRWHHHDFIQITAQYKLKLLAEDWCPSGNVYFYSAAVLSIWVVQLETTIWREVSSLFHFTENVLAQHLSFDLCTHPSEICLCFYWSRGHLTPRGLGKSRADLSGKRRGCSGWAKEIRANKVSTSHPGCLLSFYRPYFRLRLPAAEVFSHLLSPLYNTARSPEELLTRYDWKMCSSWTRVHTEYIQSRWRERRFFKQSYLKLGLD